MGTSCHGLARVWRALERGKKTSLTSNCPYIYIYVLVDSFLYSTHLSFNTSFLGSSEMLYAHVYFVRLAGESFARFGPQEGSSLLTYNCSSSTHTHTYIHVNSFSYHTLTFQHIFSRLLGSVLHTWRVRVAGWREFGALWSAGKRRHRTPTLRLSLAMLADRSAAAGKRRELSDIGAVRAERRRISEVLIKIIYIYIYIYNIH